MRNTLFFFITLLCLISCDNPEKYKGRWSNYMPKHSYFNHEIRSVEIESDSIKFNFAYFQYSNKFPLKIKDKKFKFNNLSFDVSIEKDTLALNDSIYFFVKDELDTLYGSEIILKIDLPKSPHLISLKLDEKNLNMHIHYGKRIDNQNYALKLNDKISEIRDLLHFIPGGSCHNSIDFSKITHTVLSMDKTSTLNHFEEIVYYLRLINYLNIDLVNDSDLSYNDSIGFKYDFKILPQKLEPLRENDTYRPNKKELPPPPPPPYHPMFEDKNLESKFIYLKEDQLYYQDKIISILELKTLIKPWIKNNNVVFSLYDLESTYGKFLEMTAIISSVYEEVREKASQEQFNTSLDDVSKEEIIAIKTKFPMRHIWSFSIPHFNHVVKNNGSFFGLNVNLASDKE